MEKVAGTSIDSLVVYALKAKLGHDWVHDFADGQTYLQAQNEGLFGGGKTTLKQRGGAGITPENLIDWGRTQGVDDPIEWAKDIMDNYEKLDEWMLHVIVSSEKMADKIVLQGGIHAEIMQSWYTKMSDNPLNFKFILPIQEVTEITNNTAAWDDIAERLFTELDREDSAAGIDRLEDEIRDMINQSLQYMYYTYYDEVMETALEGGPLEPINIKHTLRIMSNFKKIIDKHPLTSTIFRNIYMDNLHPIFCKTWATLFYGGWKQIPKEFLLEATFLGDAFLAEIDNTLGPGETVAIALTQEGGTDITNLRQLTDQLDKEATNPSYISMITEEIAQATTSASVLLTLKYANHIPGIIHDGAGAGAGGSSIIHDVEGHAFGSAMDSEKYLDPASSLKGLPGFYDAATSLINAHDEYIELLTSEAADEVMEEAPDAALMASVTRNGDSALAFMFTMMEDLVDQQIQVDEILSQDWKPKTSEGGGTRRHTNMNGGAVAVEALTQRFESWAKDARGPKKYVITEEGVKGKRISDAFINHKSAGENAGYAFNFRQLDPLYKEARDARAIARHKSQHRAIESARKSEEDAVYHMEQHLERAKARQHADAVAKLEVEATHAAKELADADAADQAEKKKALDKVLRLQAEADAKADAAGVKAQALVRAVKIAAEGAAAAEARRSKQIIINVFWLFAHEIKFESAFGDPVKSLTLDQFKNFVYEIIGEAELMKIFGREIVDRTRAAKQADTGFNYPEIVDMIWDYFTQSNAGTLATDLTTAATPSAAAPVPVPVTRADEMTLTHFENFLYRFDIVPSTPTDKAVLILEEISIKSESGLWTGNRRPPDQRQLRSVLKRYQQQHPFDKKIKGQFQNKWRAKLNQLKGIINKSRQNLTESFRSKGTQLQKDNKRTSIYILKLTLGEILNDIGEPPQMTDITHEYDLNTSGLSPESLVKYYTSIYNRLDRYRKSSKETYVSVDSDLWNDLGIYLSENTRPGPAGWSTNITTYDIVKDAKQTGFTDLFTILKDKIMKLDVGKDETELYIDYNLHGGHVVRLSVHKDTRYDRAGMDDTYKLVKNAANIYHMPPSINTTEPTQRVCTTQMVMDPQPECPIGGGTHGIPYEQFAGDPRAFDNDAIPLIDVATAQAVSLFTQGTMDGGWPSMKIRKIQGNKGSPTYSDFIESEVHKSGASYEHNYKLVWDDTGTRVVHSGKHTFTETMSKTKVAVSIISRAKSIIKSLLAGTYTKNPIIETDIRQNAIRKAFGDLGMEMESAYLRAVSLFRKGYVSCHISNDRPSYARILFLLVHAQAIIQSSGNLVSGGRLADIPGWCAFENKSVFTNGKIKKKIITCITYLSANAGYQTAIGMSNPPLGVDIPIAGGSGFSISPNRKTQYKKRRNKTNRKKNKKRTNRKNRKRRTNKHGYKKRTKSNKRKTRSKRQKRSKRKTGTKRKKRSKRKTRTKRRTRT